MPQTLWFTFNQAGKAALIKHTHTHFRRFGGCFFCFFRQARLPVPLPVLPIVRPERVREAREGGSFRHWHGSLKRRCPTHTTGCMYTNTCQAVGVFFVICLHLCAHAHVYMVRVYTYIDSTIRKSHIQHALTRALLQKDWLTNCKCYSICTGFSNSGACYAGGGLTNIGAMRPLTGDWLVQTLGQCC